MASPILRYELPRLALLLAAGVAACNTLAGVLAGLTGFLAWHAWQAARFMRSTQLPGPEQRSAPAGLWRALSEMRQTAPADSQKTRHEFHQYRARAEAVGAAFPEPMLLIDREGRLGWCNAAARNLLGCRPSGDLGKPLQDVIRNPVLNEYLAQPKPEHALEISAPADKARLLSIRLFPLGDGGERLLVARDVTRVYNLDAARRDFVANVSHELRTPLTVIGGYLEPLSETLADDDDWSSHLELMKQEAARMEDLIRDLTLLSRLESADEKSRSDARIDLPTLIGEIATEARALSGDALHDIRVDIPAGAALVGDLQEIRSAVSNLIFNAVRHTPARTRIDIGWHNDGEHNHLTVRDFGKGIAARHIPRLTERFYRADAGRSRAHGGTGLGLAIVKHILQRHDAELIIDSKVGSGTVFTCLFPCQNR